ncbi:MAG: hypothetical protein QXL51_00175 [Candidatus Aenigmatarchaeota archaeon]
MKYQLTLLIVDKCSFEDLKGIRSLIEFSLPRIPKVVNFKNKKYFIKTKSIFFDKIKDLQKYFNLNEKEWQILKKSIEVRLENNQPIFLLTTEKCYLGAENG